MSRNKLACVLAAGSLTIVVCAVAGASPHQVDRRQKQDLYARLCSACHGPTLQGAEGSPAINGERFDRKWAGKSVYALYRKIRVTMPQDDPGSLSAEDALRLTALVLAANGNLPIRLPSDPDILKRIRIEDLR